MAADPLRRPPPSLATAMRAFATSAIRTVLRLSPASRTRPRLRRLTGSARESSRSICARVVVAAPSPMRLLYPISSTYTPAIWAGPSTRAVRLTGEGICQPRRPCTVRSALTLSVRAAPAATVIVATAAAVQVAATSAPHPIDRDLVPRNGRPGSQKYSVINYKLSLARRNVARRRIAAIVVAAGCLLAALLLGACGFGGGDSDIESVS